MTQDWRLAKPDGFKLEDKACGYDQPVADSLMNVIQKIGSKSIKNYGCFFVNTKKQKNKQ